MKLSYNAGSRILSVAILAGIWSAACSSDKNDTGVGGTAGTTGGTTSASSSTGGAKTGGAPSTGGTKAAATGGAPAATGGAPAGTGGAKATGGTTAAATTAAATGGAATGGVTSTGTSTTAGGATTGGVTGTNTSTTAGGATGGVTGTSTSTTAGGGTTSTGGSTATAGGGTSTGTGGTGATAAVQYVMNQASFTANTAGTSGQTTLSTASVAVTAGDWIIIDTTLAYTNIGQTYAQLWFTPTSTGTTGYPSFGQIYQTTTTNSVAYYRVYIVPESGTISGIVFNNNSYDGSAMAALPAGTTVTYTNLKIARIAAADLGTLAPALVNQTSATMAYYHDTSGTTPADNLQYSPTTVSASAVAGNTLVGVFTRPAITVAYAAHYLNSGLASWGATYPDATAQTVFIYEPITAAATTTWLQLGIQGQSPATTDTLAISNVQVRVVPAL